jgi:hypothetical protein
MERRSTVLKEVRGGRNTYGEVIGIILIERHFPRLPGEMGNATTFDFPVRFHVVKGVDVSTRLKMHEGDASLIEPFLRGVKELEQAGVRAITTNCGFLIRYQDILADAADIPVFTSSLLQIPMVYRMLRKGQKIGVLTADAGPGGLGKAHFEAAGAGHIPIEVMGMENYEEFQTYLYDRLILRPEKVKEEMVDAARRLVSRAPEIGALVMECANMPIYGKAVQEAVRLPIFDFITMTHMVYSAVVKKEFDGLL